MLVSVNTTITETATFNVAQTNGTPLTLNETINKELSDVVSNFDDVSNITINNLSYKFKNPVGNSAAVIQSATIVINGVSVVNQSNINITQEATNQTVFTITNSNILTQLETLFLNNTSVSIETMTSTISEAGPISFDLEFSLQIGVDFN